MTDADRQLDRPGDAALRAVFVAIASRDQRDVMRRLAEAPGLAITPIGIGARRQDPSAYFLPQLRHYVYAGDTVLHLAAAAHERGLVAALVARGADVGARNRRGAEPLHYAADGSPGSGDRDPVAQCDVIRDLIEAGADPNSVDNSGVAPLHRAVRNRCSAAVRALIENGAEPRLPNGHGSTPLHLAVQNTGKSGSGSKVAKDEQRRIIATLLEYGASPDDVDNYGKSVVGGGIQRVDPGDARCRVLSCWQVPAAPRPPRR